MKNPILEDYLLWEGKLAKIVAETDRRMVVIELIEDRKCPHCGESVGKEQIHVIPSSPYFQDNAESIRTITDD